MSAKWHKIVGKVRFMHLSRRNENKHIRLFPKLQGNMCLLPNMRLLMKAKIDYTPKPQCLFGIACVTRQKSWVVEVVDVVPLKFASDEAAGWKVDILEPPLHWV